MLKTGLLHADIITAVSRTYAQEIQGPDLGFDLDWLTRARAGRLLGIVNGMDYGTWDPARTLTSPTTTPRTTSRANGR